MRKASVIGFLLIFSVLAPVLAQEKVDFPAEDGLTVAADEYFVHDSLPWILMFHQAGSSRGEFREIAPKLTKLGYNGLAVDLRHGKEINFVPNLTNMTARDKDYPHSMKDASKDIMGAINWIAARTNSEIILFGSSFSASLVMILARDNPDISAVIAFSPGEFFGHSGLVQNAVRNLDIPVFLASTKREYPYVTELSSEIPGKNKVIFTPSECQGVHGAKALWESEEGSQEYWLGLMMFINRLKTVQD